MKLSSKILKIMKSNITNSGINFMIYIAKLQDSLGVINGIHYKDVCFNLSISKTTFYKIIEDLVKTDIIEAEHDDSYSYWTIKIIDNVFSNLEDCKKGYINTNIDIFHSRAFIRSTKTEKIIIFNFLFLHKMSKYKSGKYHLKSTISRLMEWTGRSKRTVIKSINSISKFVYISTCGGVVTIDPLIFLFKKSIEPELNAKKIPKKYDPYIVNEKYIRNKHLIQFRLKKFKIKESIENIRDTAIVFINKKINEGDKIIKCLDSILSNKAELSGAYMNSMLTKKILAFS
ncbi:MAG: hypothetical protein LBB45_05415 [Methanobrevibacter sp.]|jgi:hypothetical protein|nr:hypothetical protein [Candidatus Methanovirga basalitermitum]